jgi:membrane protease YdiL (CAAX protease family)
MKKVTSILFVVLFVAAFFAMPVLAQGLHQEAQPLDLTGMLKAAGQFILGSAAIAAAATFLVNTAKSAGFVTDTQSMTWVSGINFVLIVGVFLAKLFAPTFDLGIIEKVADGIAKQGPGFILPLMPLLVVFSKWIHGAVKGAKWIGTSHTLNSVNSLKAGKK